MQAESLLLMAACWIYLGAAALAAALPADGRVRHGAVLSALALALILHAVSIGLRWERLGHGPYVDLFEILSSNVWSLHFVVFVACLIHRRLSATLSAALPVLAILTLWLIVTPSRDTVAPVTYQTIWLPLHMVLGKVFLGLVVVAVGASLIVLGRRFSSGLFRSGPSSAVLESLAHRMMLFAVVFQTLMLIAGAAWARDAWGRYWAWDPLESWAFLTWLVMLGYLHWRPRNTRDTTVNSVLVVAVYVVAFATFFGVPFISTAPHKGAI